MAILLAQDTINICYYDIANATTLN